MSPILLFAIAVIVIYFVSNFITTRNIQSLSGEEAKNKVTQEKKETTFIDVRSPGEYSGGHAKGFVNIPLEQLPQKWDKFSKEKPIVVMCASGSRSMRACKMLTKNGFNTVYNVKGGFSRYPR